MTGYLTANDRPGEHASSWYAETAHPLPDHPPLQGAAQADLCIVGAGYAGLSAALHAAQSGLKVIVLEANRIGWGASGRNGGQVGIGPRASVDEYERKVGRDDARKVWDIAVGANALVRDLIRKHEIDCDLADGYVDCAWKPGHVADLHAFAEHVSTAYGHETIRPLDRAAMIELLGTERYHGGFIDTTGAHLHPLNYAIGLGRAAAAAGAEIHERSVVTRVERGRVTTAKGDVSAQNIVLACNGYLDGLMAAPQRRMMPLNNYILATEPLGDRVNRLNPQNVCASDTLFVLNYFRLSRDGRMLWGGGESLGRKFPPDLKSFVRKRMLMVYPDLADVEITHAWGGTLAITGTRIPVFQDLGGGIRAIGGWSGSGVHMATMGGKIAAEAIVGEVGDWDVLARMPTPQFPGGDWFRMPFLRLAMFWYRLLDRL
ncbi:MAG: FAD-binding oxidoreductase [Pseudomonadota bacterium]